MVETGFLKRIEITGGFLDKFDVEFSKGLNCIIGARGTGKTTALEAIRYAFAKQGVKARIDTLLKNNLQGAATKVTFEFESSPENEYLLTRFYDEKPSFAGPQGESLEYAPIFPLDVFSTDEIEEVADDPAGSRKRDLIDGFIPDIVDPLKRKCDLITGEISRNANELLVLESRAEQLQQSVGPMPQFRQRLQELTSATEGATSEEFKKEQELNSIRQKESAYLDYAMERIDHFEQLMRPLLLANRESVVLLSKQRPSGKQNTELIESVDKLTEELFSFAQAQNEKILSLLTKNKSEILSLKNKLAASHRQQKGRYDKLREEHSEISSKIKERDQLQASLERLEKDSEELSDTNKKLSRLKEERIHLLDALREERAKITAERRKIAQMITKSSMTTTDDEEHPDLRVVVTAQGDRTEFKELLQTALQGSKLKYGQLVDTTVEKCLPIEFATFVRSNDVAKVSQIAEVDESRAETVIEYLRNQPQILYALESISVNDKIEIQLNIAGDGSVVQYKEAAQLSTGQKCTAILPLLLLATSRGPLLIDQPENNLDNQYIFKDVIPRLEAIKKRRQLIFITHNPNIPVLAEADRVIVLGSESSASGVRGYVVKVGTVDEVKEEVISLLEGGREAFQLRANKYVRK